MKLRPFEDLPNIYVLADAQKYSDSINNPKHPVIHPTTMYLSSTYHLYLLADLGIYAKLDSYREKLWN